MDARFRITLDRTAKAPLTTQIHAAVRDAILEKQTLGGARLPSWRDLAAQLGVARGAVRAAAEARDSERAAGPLAEALLSGDIVDGSTVRISTDAHGLTLNGRPVGKRTHAQEKVA